VTSGSTSKQEKDRARRLAKYGETIASYDARFRAQGGVCKICGRPPKKIRLAVDHCHKLERQGIMKVRGLLCGFCNRKILGVIERYGVNPQKIVDYLAESK
jgi:hypothetical protein